MKRTRGGAADSVLERVAGSISRYSMFGPADPVGVAVSGGADSLVLLHILNEIRPPKSLFVLHLNHKLRGGESDADVEFVAGQAAALGLPFELREVDVAAAGGNLEEAGRRARHEFYRDAISRGLVARVATGHTLDDQAETVLYRLLRGSGTQGLRGILPVTREGLVRPLIECRRAEIECWLTARGLRWREDASNADQRFTRNRIRHSLLPLLESEYNPQIRSTLTGLARIAADEEEWWSEQVARVAPDVISSERGAILLDVKALQTLPVALNRRVVRHVLGQVRAAEHVEAVLELAFRASGHGRLHLPGVDIVRSFNQLRISPRTSGDNPITAQVFESYNKVGNIDGDLVPAGAEVRLWRPGDRLELSPGRTVKLKELFQRARIPVWERRNWPVLAYGSEVIWTRRFGVGAKFAAGQQTRRYFEVVEDSAGA